MTTHIVGGGIGAVVLAMAIFISISHNDPWSLVGGIVYGMSMIALYAVSSVYHGLPGSHAKRIMRIIDHCTIYLLIAGTYTPILLAAIRPLYPSLAWTVFGCEWGFAALGAALTAIDLKKYAKFSMLCYLAMGWFIILVLRQTVETISLAGFMWLLAGGVAYTVGAVLYGVGKKKRYIHSVFHIFVDVGSILQAVCILRYVL